MKKGNFIVAGIFAALAIFILISVSSFPAGDDGVPGPGLWPMIIAVIILLSSITIAINTIKISKADDKSLNLTTKDAVRVYITMGGLTIYLFLMYFLGFCTASILLLFSLIMWFSAYKWWKCLIISIAITVIVYFVFNYILKVPFRFGLLI